MNPLWLILIVPMSMVAGAFCMALVTVGDCDPVWYDEDRERLRDTV